MQKVFRAFFDELVKRPSLYFFVFLIIFSFSSRQNFEYSQDRQNGPFYGEVLSYYSVLPEFFLDFKKMPGQNLHTSRQTIGMAMLYLPAFFAGNWIAEATGDIADGYSLPYQQSARWGSILYCIAGLAFCCQSLLMFFPEIIVTLSLICIFFATNLFFYTYGLGELPHSYLFFLNAAFMYFTLKWIREEKPVFLLLLAFTGGMITLIRPIGILVFLFPLLYSVNTVNDLGLRIRHFFKNDLLAFLSCVLFSLPLLVQALIWKAYQGHYFNDPYEEGRFFFKDPQLLNFLFSFRKGWLIYTPVMALALIGIVLSAKKLREFFPFILLYFLLNLYVLSCWWDWAYGDSFGCSPLIGSYAFLVFPLAVFISWIWKLRENKKLQQSAIRLSTLFVFYLLIQLNLFQTWQYKNGWIHGSGMNREAFRHVFLREISVEEAGILKKYYALPDLEKMKRGERDQ